MKDGVYRIEITFPDHHGKGLAILAANRFNGGDDRYLIQGSLHRFADVEGGGMAVTDWQRLAGPEQDDYVPCDFDVTLTCSSRLDGFVLSGLVPGGGVARLGWAWVAPLVS